MAFVVKDDESPNPGDVGVLGPRTVVSQADRLSHAIKKPWRQAPRQRVGRAGVGGWAVMTGAGTASEHRAKRPRRVRSLVPSMNLNRGIFWHRES